MKWRARVRSIFSLVAVFALPSLARRAAALVDDGLLRTSLDWLRDPLSTLLETFANALGGALGATVFLAFLVGPVIAIAGVVSRARTRAGLADPLARARAFAARRPRVLDAVVMTPALLTGAAMMAFAMRRGSLSTEPAAIALAVLLAGLTQVRLARGAGKTFLANEKLEAPQARTGITYQAVARTRETIGAIAVLSVMSVAMVALVSSVSRTALVRDPRVLAAVIAYVVISSACAVVFRRASRAAIGIDGVRIYGTSREHFVAYRDVDAVRTRGVDIELMRGERVVLAVQLHGLDAGRQDEVVAHIASAIERASSEGAAPTAQLVTAASGADLERLAEGASDYRSAAISRDQLWDVAVSPTLDASTRAQALAALAKRSDPAERERLRVAVEQCAAPHVRALATEEDDVSPPPDDEASLALRHR